jgi:hypothetical protein
MFFKTKSNKKLSIFTALFGCFLFCSFLQTRKSYFSLTEIKADTFKKSISISAKLFIDDLENALNKSNHKKRDLSKSANKAVIQSEVFAYINQHLQLYINNKLVVLNYLGYETENDVIWIYLESRLIENDLKSAKVTNSILYDFTPEQINMIQFKWNNKNFTEKLNYPNTVAIFKE